MNETQQAVVTLMKSAITGKTGTLPEGFSLAEAYPSLRCHHMDALLFDGAVRCGISRKEEIMQTLFQRYCRALLKSEGQMQQVQRIFRAFDENGIDYLPLKGCKMKVLYPKPELRTMGDADILIRLEQREKIAPIMESMGFTCRGDSDHEWIWRNDRLFVELHKRLIPSYNKDYHRYFSNPWKFAQVEEGCRYSMTPEDELIFLFTHFAKHFRDGGIGCRYVLDLWVYLRTHPALDETYLQEKLTQLQLWEFYGNIRRLMQVWFEDAPGDEKTDFITDYIFSSGSWGKSESKVLSRGVRDKGKEGTSSKSKRAYFWRTAFPNKNTLQNKYTILQKAPWMLPAVWAYRPFYKLICEKEDVIAHREKIRTLTPENLQTRQDALKYMDIGYDF